MKNAAAERGREVRARLVAAATELIPELGWSAVSTRVLAERAGVAPGLVHYHFDSLQALLREASIGQIRELLQGMEPLLEQARGLDEGVALLLGSLDGYTGRDRMSLLVTETYLAAGRDEALRAALSVLVTDFRVRLADWLRTHLVVDPEPVASLVAAAIDGVMLHRSLNPELTSSAVGPVLQRLLRKA